ncbi:MAG: tripartite tricarboxylate transporter TctB family protein [Betaproteobacteria bacterium]|nr:tripartite tricarboxylate transporter TctB family protein [Betaproteobacteria bacterium]MCC6250175.1 tripartite tricarboxylate transporter TctB family protein [Rubrivivax sp.]
MGQRLHQTLIGLAALALGALLAAGATGISAQAGYAGVGPNFLPWVVAAVLGACGVWLTIDARREGGWRDLDPPSGAPKGDWTALAWVAAGIVATALLLTTAGFVLACTACFMLAVRGLRGAEGKPHGGARGLVLDFVTGFLIAGPAYWVFTKLLGINLPGLTGTGWI